MRIVPKLTDSCGCCTLKTGSFVNAILLLVGHGVMTGFYAFLVDHMYPQHICDYQRVEYEDVPVTINRTYFPRDDCLFPFFCPPAWYYPSGDLPPYEEDADNATNETDRGFISPTDWGFVNPSGRNSSWNRRGGKARRGGSSTRRRTSSTFTVYTRRAVWVPYKAPCVRERVPFKADVNFLDYDLRGPFDHSILYFNIVVWVTLMAATPVLMMGVYKESVILVTVWVVIETLLLMVGAAGTVATAVFMFSVIPITIGIITLINLAIHLGIDIYLIMVVVNYRRELKAKEEDDSETEPVIV